MATRKVIEGYLNMLPRYRNQPEGFIRYLAQVGAKVGSDTESMAAFLEKMRLEGRLCENLEYRAAFNALWENPIECFWGYKGEAAEEMLVRTCTAKGLPITVDSLELVFPEVQAKLGVSNAYVQHQQKLARDVKDKEDRATITSGLLSRFEYDFRAARRRDGDVQKLQHIARALDKEKQRLDSLDINQLRVEGRALVADDSAKQEAARLQNLGVTELRETVSTQQPPQVYRAPAQAYGNNGHQPLPADYNGKPWTVKLLYSMTPREQDHVMKLYGGPAIDRAIAANRTKGIR